MGRDSVEEKQEIKIRILLCLECWVCAAAWRRCQGFAWGATEGKSALENNCKNESGLIDFNNRFLPEGRRSWRHEAPRAGAQVRARQAQAQARVQVSSYTYLASEAPDSGPGQLLGTKLQSRSVFSQKLGLFLAPSSL